MFRTSNYFFGYAFDAILTLTSAFEQLNLCPTQFYNDSVWRQPCWRRELINIIKGTDMEGVTGRIRFNNGDRIGEITIEQILGGKEYTYNHLYTFFYIVSRRERSPKVEIVQLYVALPNNQSKYILLPARNQRNITWHGRKFLQVFFFD